MTMWLRTKNTTFVSFGFGLVSQKEKLDKSLSQRGKNIPDEGTPRKFC